MTQEWNRFIERLIAEGKARRNADGIAIHEEPNTLRIDELYAFLSVDKDGNEGLCAAPMAGMAYPVPMIAADPQRLRSLFPMAEYLAQHTGMTITLVRMGTRETLRTIYGGKTR